MTTHLGPLLTDINPTYPERELEAIVDKASISFTLAALAQVAYAKSDHVASNWQDASLAKQWEQLGEKLDALADTVDM